MNKDNIIYFCVEGSTDSYEPLIKDYCKDYDMDVIYWRSLKDGHIPSFRECKIRGTSGRVKAMLDKIGISTIQNPHIMFKRMRRGKVVPIIINEKERFVHEGYFEEEAAYIIKTVIKLQKCNDAAQKKQLESDIEDRKARFFKYYGWYAATDIKWYKVYQTFDNE